MNKTVIAGGIVAVAIVISMAYGAQMNPGGNDDSRIYQADLPYWNVRISGPEYENISEHKYEDILLNKQQSYKIHFVAMGDSPGRIKITVFEGTGDQVEISRSNLVYSDRFFLERELVDTGISKYYRYYYSEGDYLDLSDKDCRLGGNGGTATRCDSLFTVVVERFDNLEGSVSIGFIPVDRSI